MSDLSDQTYEKFRGRSFQSFTVGQRVLVVTCPMLASALFREYWGNEKTDSLIQFPNFLNAFTLNLNDFGVERGVVSETHPNQNRLGCYLLNIKQPGTENEVNEILINTEKAIQNELERDKKSIYKYFPWITKDQRNFILAIEVSRENIDPLEALRDITKGLKEIQELLKLRNEEEFQTKHLELLLKKQNYLVLEDSEKNLAKLKSLAKQILGDKISL